MLARRILVAASLLGAAPLLFTALAASPASAHGTLDIPVSRTAACGLEDSPQLKTDACQAALEANGGTPFEFDNLRVADVNGRDREVIPDGKLCSGGKPEFRGLDIIRSDWPTTKLNSGTTFRFRYPSTIPHTGSFRLYVTKDGYDPAQALTWDALETEPFLDVADPPLIRSAYRFSGTLPKGKTGRHLIYTIWQNTSTADTYYSCSDVVFSAAATAPKPPAPAAPAPRKPKAPPVADESTAPLPAADGDDVAAGLPPVLSQSPTSAAPPAAPAPVPSSVAVSTVSVRRSNNLGVSLLVGTIAAALALGAVIGVRQYRTRRENA